MVVYSLASAYWEHATHAELITYQVPTTQAFDQLADLNSDNNQLTQSDHAISSTACFPPIRTNSSGYIVSRLIGNSTKLELSWVQLNRPSTTTQSTYNALDHSPTLPPVRFEFPNKLIHQPVVCFGDEDAASVSVFALSVTGQLYQLSFTGESLFYDEDLADWSHEWAVNALNGKAAVLLESVDSNRVVVGCEDGSAFALEVAEDSSLGVTELRPSSSFSMRSLIPSFSSRSLSAAAAAHSTSSPSQLVDLAAGPTFSFGVSRDRKLKIWALESGACLKAIELPRPVSAPPLGGSYFGSAASSVAGSEFDDPTGTPSRGRRGVALLPAAPQSLIKLLPPPTNSHFAATLLLFAPSNAGAPPAFFLYGVRLDNAGNPNELTPLAERTCTGAAGQGRLVDFGCAAFGLAGAVEGWNIWALWEEVGTTEIRTVRLSEMEGASGTAGLDEVWTSVGRSDGGVEHDPSYFDGLLLDDASAVARVFAAHVAHPGRYSPSTLDYALSLYEGVLNDELSGFVRPIALDTEYDSILDRIAAVVGCTAQLEHSAQTGAPMYGAYFQRLKLEWLRFVAMLEESRTAAQFPVALAVESRRGLALALLRDGVSAPVVLDTAGVLISLSAQQGEAAAGRRAFLALPPHALSKVHPHLALPDTRQDLFAILAAANELEAGLSGPASRALESQLITTLRKPLRQNIEDVALELYEAGLEPSIDGERAGRVSERLRALLTPEASFHALWQLLTTAHLIGPDMAPSQSGRASDLAQVLLADVVATAIEGRYQLAKSLATLLLFIYVEQDGLIGNMSALTSGSFATLHTLASLRWVSRQTAVPVNSGAQEDGGVDVLAKFNEMNMSAHHEDSSNLVPPFSLLHGLLRDPAYSPLLGCPSPASAMPTSLTQAGSGFLSSVGLITAKRLVIDTPKDVEFGLRLANKGLSALALEFVEMYPQGAGMHYVLGLAYLDLARVDEAQKAFARAAPSLYVGGEEIQLDDSSDLSHILPDVAGSLGRYYAHVVGLLGAREADAAVAKFAGLAIEAFEDEDVTDEAIEKDLWLKRFRSEASLGAYEAAYTTLMATPYLDTKSTCLAHLISVMCETGAAGQLLSFAFVGLQPELERHLAFRARNSDPRAEPNYFKILYAYHVTKGDHRSAAATMFAQGRRIGDLTARPGEARELARLQCQSLLAAANALALVDKKHAWVAVAAAEEGDGRGKRRKLAYHIPDQEYQPATGPAEVVELEDVRREYTIALARLHLAAKFPEVERTSFGLDGEAVVALHAQVAEFDRAFAAARTLGIDMATLFGTVTERCVGLALQPTATQDVEWIASNDEAATWEGSLASKGWKLLERHLDRHDDDTFHYRMIVLQRNLDLNPTGKVPTFLTDFLQAHDAQSLIRTMLRYDRLEDAFRFSQAAIKAQQATAPSSFSSCLPYSLFDQLLAIPAEDSASLTKAELVARQAELKQVLDARMGVLDKAQKNVLRAAR